MDNTALDDFGAALSTEVRDRSIEWLDKFENGTVRAEPDVRLHEEIESMSRQDKEVSRHLARRLIDETIHNFLWMIEQSDRFDLVAQVDDGAVVSLTESSDGLSVEPNRWFPQFSRFGEVIL